jgi:ATP-dependent Clp protease ATP-binding subunit ClpA
VTFARLSPEARETMVLAQDEAGRLRHPWVGTEHLLLALPQQPDTRAQHVLSSLGVTAASLEHELVEELGTSAEQQRLGDLDEQALRSLGIDLREVRRRVEAVFGPGALDRARPGQCGVPMMPRLKQTLKYAAHVGRGDAIDTDHLLVGMTNVHGTLAMSLLQKLGVGPEAVRATVEAHRRQVS